MQERLLLEPEPEPEQVVPEVEVRLPQNAQAMVRSDGEQQEEGSGGAGGAAGEGGEPEGPKLSRDEEIHQTATRMYWLGYAFLCDCARSSFLAHCPLRGSVREAQLADASSPCAQAADVDRLLRLLQQQGPRPA